MPSVGGKKFPYTPSGEKAAKSYSDKTGKSEKILKGKGDAMSASAATKKAVAGQDLGKPGKNFSKIASKAGKEYGSAEAGKKVAGSIFQNMRKKGKL